MISDCGKVTRQPMDLNHELTVEPLTAISLLLNRIEALWLSLADRLQLGFYSNRFTGVDGSLEFVEDVGSADAQRPFNRTKVKQTGAQCRR